MGLTQSEAIYPPLVVTQQLTGEIGTLTEMKEQNLVRAVCTNGGAPSQLLN